MREIGRVKRLQIQRSSLKMGERPTMRYDPSPLLVADRLWLNSRGVFGLVSGSYIIDVHHADHPASHHAGVNPISIGFTRHYREMRARFGDHLFDGCAGENILIESDQPISLEAIGRGIAVHQSDGQIIYLADILVAAPCVEFSQYAARTPNLLSPHQMKETLQFLDNGMRGFYATVDGQPAPIQAGDRVFLVE